MQVSQKSRKNYGNSQFLRGKEATSVVRRLGNIQGDGCDIRSDPNGIRIRVAQSNDSSFAYLKVDEDGNFYVRTGAIRWSGKTSYKLPEDDSRNKAPVTGSVGSPCIICLRISSSEGPSSAQLVSMADEASCTDDGTFFYKPLYEAYLDEAGNIVKGKDRRPDWNLSSPI